MPYNVDGYRRRARRRLPGPLFHFIDGGAGDEWTLRANREQFERYRLAPRALVDVSAVDLSTALAGRPLALPLAFSPTGFVGLAHPDGEPAAGIVANERAILAIISTYGTYSIEECAAIAGQGHWLGLVPWVGHPNWRTLVDRAEAAGYSGLVVAVDAAVNSNRERDLRNGWTAPPRILSHAHSYAVRPGWIARTLRHRRATLRNVDPTPPTLIDFIRRASSSADAHADDVDSMTWDELAWLRERWRGPLAIKGPVSGPDAARMADIGVDVIVLGNHGGRQLDGVRPALEQLREVLDATGGRVEVVVDGGIRRGADVVKALCLGAKACSIGRPWVYGLAAAGTAGVRGVVDLLEAEIRITMSLLGVRGVGELDETLVRTIDAR